MATEVVPNIDDEAYEPQTYDEAFPALHSNRNDSSASVSHGDIKLAVRSTKTTQIFTVPLEERRFKEINEHSFGEEGEQAKICREIMQKTGVSIEMSLAKDQSLTVVISGKPEDVMKARREVVSELQTQASFLIKIPKEHHRFILGKNGKKLQELELSTATKIIIPRTENSDFIRIVGTKEGIEKARHEIQCTSDEQAKLAFERLPVPKIYHPFICGPHNNNIKALIESTNAQINVPPPSVMKDEIVVSGEKEGVMKAKATIMKILEEKKKKCQAVSVEVRKSQHKYVIGQKRANIQEILEMTGVSVEVPSLESTSGTITLRGEEDKLGPALTMVYSKANSVIVEEVTVPAWLHRFIIGRQGASVKKITQNTPKVHIEFTDGQDMIVIEGPPEEVEECVSNLTEFVTDLEKRMAFAEIEVDQRFHKHIIGKNGANISRIKSETGVAIQIPSDSVNNNVIRIEGDPNGVQKAKQELLEMAQRMENEKSRDIVIEQRFHKTIIGARGEKIREIRDMFNQVQITFPDAGKKSDVVTLRGPKNDVDKAYKHLSQYHQELVTNNFQSQVQIFKEFHKNIIGKGGATIRKIRDETDTRIDLPSENSDSDMIIITGKKANVELAKQKIEAIQKELANIKEITVEIPSKFHNSIIGAKGRLIRAILEECSGVLIRFPPEGSSSDKVVIRGPIEDAENARRQLQELTSEKQMSSYTADIKAKPEYHKFLIGRGGTNIKKVREKTGARVIFPTDQDHDPELISIIGRKEAVEQAKVELEALIQNLDNIVEGEISVDPKHHRYFVARRGEVLRQIADEYGGVTVSFPRSGVKSDRVVIKGAKDCVEGAKRRILEIVADLDAQVVVECVISQRYHRTVMGARGQKVQEITRLHDVAIKFPDRPVNGERSSQPPTEETDSSTAAAIPNGDVSPESETPADINKSDIILITGKPHNCEEAKKALLALVPITEEVEVPFEFHRFIIGQKGKDVRKMMEDHEVSITVPPPEEKSNIISVTGPPSNVQGAKAALEERCVILENEKQDKILRSFKLEIEVEPSYHPKIIGRKGAVISKIRADHDVNIQFPERGDAQNIITITGYELNANKAKEAILKIVEELDSMSVVEVKVDHRVHPRIIGLKGRMVRRLMEEYKVDIRFPRPDTDDPDIITITGAEEDCLDCHDYLMAIEEEFLQDVIDQEYLENLKAPPARAEVNGAPKESKGFFVKDAPWDKVPDTASTEEFPSFGTVVTPKPSQAWGPLKRK